jgi:hypothetical protein
MPSEWDRENGRLEVVLPVTEVEQFVATATSELLEEGERQLATASQVLPEGEAKQIAAPQLLVVYDGQLTLAGIAATRFDYTLVLVVEVRYPVASDAVPVHHGLPSGVIDAASSSSETTPVGVIDAASSASPPTTARAAADATQLALPRGGIVAVEAAPNGMPGAVLPAEVLPAAVKDGSASPGVVVDALWGGVVHDNRGDWSLNQRPAWQQSFSALLASSQPLTGVRGRSAVTLPYWTAAPSPTMRAEMPMSTEASSSAARGSDLPLLPVPPVLTDMVLQLLPDDAIACGEEQVQRFVATLDRLSEPVAFVVPHVWARPALQAFFAAVGSAGLFWVLDLRSRSRRKSNPEQIDWSSSDPFPWDTP